MNRDEAIAELCQFLEEQGGEVEEITPAKLRDRALFIEDRERPDCIIFMLERHHGIMGASYKPGYGMTAFVTYWPVYAFDRQTRTLNEIRRAKLDEVTIDYDHFAAEDCNLSFELSPIGNGRWKYHESCYGEGGIVSGQKGLERVASRMVDGLDFTGHVDMLSDYCGKAEAAEHARRLAEAYEKKAQEQARWAWKHAQEESDLP